MRRVTRNLVLGVVGVLLVLLALGALPGLLKSGDPYYVTATPTDEGHEAVDAGDLSTLSYEYTWAALENASATGAGRSGPYWKGPVGLKEPFTHSPFDERSAIAGRYPNATAGEAYYVARNGTLYRLAVGQ